MKFLRNDPTLKERRRKLRRDQTDAEKALWGHLRNKRFHGMKFFRQYSVGPYVLDFYCSTLRLAIELDGGQHNLGQSMKRDAIRSEYLKAQGIEVIRFWNNDVLLNMEGVLAALELRITPPSPS